MNLGYSITKKWHHVMHKKYSQQQIVFNNDDIVLPTFTLEHGDSLS